jgi:hypothetical protein
VRRGSNQQGVCKAPKIWGAVSQPSAPAASGAGVFRPAELSEGRRAYVTLYPAGARRLILLGSFLIGGMLSEDPESPLLGDCYKAAFENAELLARIKACVEADESPDPGDTEYYHAFGLNENPIAVVHGTAVPPVGPYANRMIRHAWIEIGDAVVETSNGINASYKPRSRFYERFGAVPQVRYSVNEARRLADAKNHFGPWHS